jgi:hypothetical protein
MKIIILIFSWLMIISEASAMSDSLKTLIKAINGKEDGEYGYDQRMIAAWPNLDSEAGLHEILDLVLKPGENEAYSVGMKILRSMHFPEDQIVGKILTKVEGRKDHESGLSRAFSLLKNYTDDPRVFRYLLGFINDNRLMGRREKMLTADYDSVAPRICDGAAGVIRHGLRKRGLLKPGDPEWGESGGASSYVKAESALILLKEFLVKNQLMTLEQSLTRPKNDPKTSDSSINHSPGARTQGRESKRPDPLVASRKDALPWFWMWAGMLPLSGIVIWKLLKRRL